MGTLTIEPLDATLGAVVRGVRLAALDDATCRLISRRAQFDPATDETGARVPGTYTGSVRWELPD